MSRVLTVDGSVKIGAYRFPDRKKPCLCVEKGNACTVYGSFIDLDRANEFMMNSQPLWVRRTIRRD